MRQWKMKSRCEKRHLSKCEDVCRTYDKVQYAYATRLEEDPKQVVPTYKRQGYNHRSQNPQKHPQNTMPDFLADEMQDYLGSIYELGPDQRIFPLSNAICITK